MPQTEILVMDPISRAFLWAADALGKDESTQGEFSPHPRTVSSGVF